MNIKTLSYIHNLLKENKEKERKAMEIARTERNKAEDDEAENFPSLEKLYRKTYESFCEASNALDDFEAQEW